MDVNIMANTVISSSQASKHDLQQAKDLAYQVVELGHRAIAMLEKALYDLRRQKKERPFYSGAVCFLASKCYYGHVDDTISALEKGLQMIKEDVKYASTLR